ncbi:hypothetical protein ACEXQB_010100 [Herbiconiux sp. P18]|uniref:hypothetical protein n=1 Tax=Herbiconiux liangxiaofengii TaxID=3342795 RepID=UPI0035B92B43
MSFVLFRGVDEQNFMVLDSQGRDSGWRVLWESSRGSWTVAHADSSALSEVALSLGLFTSADNAAVAIERIDHDRG